MFLVALRSMLSDVQQLIGRADSPQREPIEPADSRRFQKLIDEFGPELEALTFDTEEFLRGLREASIAATEPPWKRHTELRMNGSFRVTTPDFQVLPLWDSPAMQDQWVRRRPPAWEPQPLLPHQSIRLFDRVLAPSSIAIHGISRRPDAIGTLVMGDGLSYLDCRKPATRLQWSAADALLDPVAAWQDLSRSSRPEVLERTPFDLASPNRRVLVRLIHSSDQAPMLRIAMGAHVSKRRIEPLSPIDPAVQLLWVPERPNVLLLRTRAVDRGVPQSLIEVIDVRDGAVLRSQFVEDTRLDLPRNRFADAADSGK
jgi:hypothetical protein